MRQIDMILLGFGSAGRAFARLLCEKEAEIENRYGARVSIVAIITGSRGSLQNSQGIDLGKALNEIETEGRFDSGSACCSDITSKEAAGVLEYDVLVELTPLNIFSGQPAIEHIKLALKRGKHVITANKGPIAWAFNELNAMAKEHGSLFYYETTVMDGTPVFNLVNDTLPLCQVTEVKGILNSTTNFILEELAKGKPYEDVLREGKQRGFIEADPAMDTDGWDAAAKTAALLNVLMDARITPEAIARTGIGDITETRIREAESRGNVIKLVCHGSRKNGRVAASVAPEEIPKDKFLAGIDGTSSIVSITTDLMGTISIVEHEPEIEQTAYGIFSDLVRVIAHL